MEKKIELNGSIISVRGGETTVEDMIECLKMCDPKAIVTYAYDEYRRSAPHGFVSVGEMVALDADGHPAFDPEDGSLITVSVEDFEKRVKYPHAVSYVPSIMLFC